MHHPLIKTSVHLILPVCSPLITDEEGESSGLCRGADVGIFQADRILGGGRTRATVRGQPGEKSGNKWNDNNRLGDAAEHERCTLAVQWQANTFKRGRGCLFLDPCGHGHYTMTREFPSVSEPVCQAQVEKNNRAMKSNFIYLVLQQWNSFKDDDKGKNKYKRMSKIHTSYANVTYGLI